MSCHMLCTMQCKSGHMGCSRCIGELPGNRCQKCEPPAMDTAVPAAMIQCPYDGYGSLVAYNEVDNHKMACPHGPCGYTEANCNFSGQPLELLCHVVVSHSINLCRFKYGIPAWQELPVPVPSEGYLLIGYGDDGNLFTMTFSALGPATVVSLLCIRSAACLWPRYTAQLLATSLSGPFGATYTVMAVIELTSTAKPGAIMLQQLKSYLAVPPQYLSEDGPDKQVTFWVCIDQKK